MGGRSLLLFSLGASHWGGLGWAGGKTDLEKGLAQGDIFSLRRYTQARRLELDTL